MGVYQIRVAAPELDLWSRLEVSTKTRKCQHLASLVPVGKSLLGELPVVLELSHSTLSDAFLSKTSSAKTHRPPHLRSLELSPSAEFGFSAETSQPKGRNSQNDNLLSAVWTLEKQILRRKSCGIRGLSDVRSQVEKVGPSDP